MSPLSIPPITGELPITTVSSLSLSLSHTHTISKLTLCMAVHGRGPIHRGLSRVHCKQKVPLYRKGPVHSTQECRGSCAASPHPLAPQQLSTGLLPASCTQATSRGHGCPSSPTRLARQHRKPHRLLRCVLGSILLPALCSPLNQGRCLGTSSGAPSVDRRPAASQTAPTTCTPAPDHGPLSSPSTAERFLECKDMAAEVSPAPKPSSLF